MDDLPDVGIKEVDFAARIFVIALIKSGAQSMSNEQKGFHGKGQTYGDYKITVEKLK